MKYVVSCSIVLAFPALAVAQEAHNRTVPVPTGLGKPWDGYNKGIRWEKSLEAALGRAAAEGKPVLFHQLVGDLDKEGC